MTQLANFNYSPPKNWQDFETLCRDLWRKIWDDRNTRKNGRSGQDQDGVDVYGQPNRDHEWAGVQCKGKDNTYEKNLVTETELLGEVKKAKNFEPPLSEWILATTGPRDAKIEKKVRKINSEHQKQGLFSVHIWFWEDIVEELVKHPDLMSLHLPQVNQENFNQIIHKLDKTESSIQTLNENSSLQMTVLQENSVAINSLNRGITAIQQIRTQDILTPYIDADIDYIRDQISDYQYENAIKNLQRLKERIWTNAPDLIKFRILSNLGSAFYGLGKLEDAGKYFREAYNYNPDHENSLVNLALSYSFQSDDENTKLYTHKVLDKNPSNINAYSILLQSIPYKNSLESCLNLVPDDLKNNAMIAFCIGLAAQTESKFADALIWFEKAVAGEPENPIFKGYLGAMLIQSLWEDGKSTLLYGQISESEKEVLNRVITVLSEALLKVENTDLKKSHLTWLLNRGIAKKLLGDTNEALQDIKHAYEAEPENPQFIKHFALITLRTEQHSAAGDLLEKIKLNRDLPEVSIFLADFYNSNNKPDKAVETIKDFLEWNTDTKFEFTARRILIDAHLQMKKYEDAKTLADKLIEDYSSEPSAFLEAAKVAYKNKAVTNATDYLNIGKRLVTNTTSISNISELGDAFFRLNMFQEAIECYEKIADPEQDSIFTYNLVNAYYESGILSKTLSICRRMREKYGISADYQKIEIWALEEINDLPQVADLAKKYLVEFPDDIRVKIKLAQISFHLDDYITTDEIINEDFDLNNLSLDVGIIVSSLLSLRNEPLKSFRLMYELRRKYFDQAEIHAFYQSNLFQRKDKELDWLSADSVDLDTAVYVEGIDGKKRVFVIEERDDADLAKNEYNVGHPLIKEMLGKVVGDEIQLKPANQNSEVGKIFEIKSKFIHASHETGEIYESTFPGRQDFQSIHIGEPEPDNEPSIHSKVREMIAGHSSHSKEGLSLYAQEPFTIGMIGKFFGLEGLESWNRLVNQSQVNVVASNGDVNLLHETTNRLSENKSRRIVADITSLQLMHELNVGDEIIAHFGKLIIAPTTLISLSRIILEKERNLTTGFMTLFEQDGQLYRNEITAEQVKNVVDYLKDFQSWIKINTEVSPYLSGFDVPRDQKEDMREALLPEFYDTVMTVKNDEYIFLTEDYRLRQFAQSEFGIQGIWMQPVLAALENKNAIFREKYYTALARMIISNLHYVNLDGRSLYETAKTLDWKVDDYFKRATDRLRGPEAEGRSSLIVATMFLLLLANEKKDTKTEGLLIICLLESITKGRNLTITLNILRQMIIKKFIFLPFGMKRVLHVIEVWERAQNWKNRGVIMPLTDLSEFNFSSI